MIERAEAIKRIRKALKEKTGKTWTVKGNRGTAWGWIDVEAPPRRRVCHDTNPKWEVWNRECTEPAYFERDPEPGEEGYYTSDAECVELQKAFGLDRPVHMQGLSISPDAREYYVAAVEAKPEPEQVNENYQFAGMMVPA